MTIETHTFDGAPAGSILSVPPHEVPDEGAVYIQDGLLHETGLLRRRGLVQAAPSVATFSDSGSGIVQTVQPNGIHRVAVLHGTATPKLGVLSEDFTTVSDIVWPGTLTTAPYYIVDAKPAVGGGTWIGTSSQVDSGSTNQYLVYWYGADKVDYTTGTAAFTRGSKAVTGAGTTWTTTVVPGMFLFTTAGAYVGVVALVTTNTALTLVDNAPFTQAAAAYSLKSTRGFIRRYAKGRLTTLTSSAAVEGAQTKFVDNLLNSGTWHIFRASDMTFIGIVTSVTSNTSLTLTANAAIALSNEHFVALKTDEDTSYAAVAASKPGFLTAVYSERQFYATGTDVRFSESGAPEDVDFDPNVGDFIPVNSSKVGAQNTPIAALAPAFNSLLVLKTNEAFAIAGSVPGQFTLHKLDDDGVLSPMSVQQYQGNVIYAGREGIYVYDGVSVTNFVHDNLGEFYKALVRSFTPNTYRMWSMLDRDHYLLSIEAVTPTYSLYKGTAVTTPTRMTICVYLPTRAVSFWTNTDLRGSITLPAATGRGTWFLVNTASGARICRSSDLFETDGPGDTLTCLSNTAGPDFYLESKRYSLGDSLRKKLWKLLLLRYYAGGDDLKFETLTGLGSRGTVSLNNWLKTILSWDSVPPLAPTWDALAGLYDTWDSLGAPVFVEKRRRFTKRTQLFGFRIYQKSTNTTAVKLASWSIGFKQLRPGRV